MPDGACGKLRQAFPAGTDPWIVQCETDAWHLFAQSCTGCNGNQSCINALYQQYLDTRAVCAEGEPDGPSGCCGEGGD